MDNLQKIRDIINGKIQNLKAVIKSPLAGTSLRIAYNHRIQALEEIILEIDQLEQIDQLKKDKEGGSKEDTITA